MMGNIYSHNQTPIDFDIVMEDYWDFCLCQDVSSGISMDGMTERCLSAYIDFNDESCVFYDNVYSRPEYVWESAVNKGHELFDIGYTGVDNGFITYEKDRISNKEFLRLFFDSYYNTEDDGLRLKLHKVNGNNQIYDYSNTLEVVDGQSVAKLNGGFYQSFFKLLGCKYQTLPHVIENGWVMETRLKKSDLYNPKTTINDTHPDNKGIFLYIGTRAENKWIQKYDIGREFDKSPLIYSDDYVDDGYHNDNDACLNGSYMAGEHDYFDDVYGEEYCKGKDVHYFDDSYVEKGYKNETTHDINSAIVSDYFEEDAEIDPNEELKTSEGFDVYQPNLVTYETDNKFLLFACTPDSYNINTWEEGTKVTIYDIKNPNIGNYFSIFHEGEGGQNIKTIGELIDKASKQYNVLPDLYRNALAFQIKDDGSVGYKYLIKDCESEEENYKIVSEFSKEGVIKDDEWYNVAVKILPLTYMNVKCPTCDGYKIVSNRKMKILIFVNGKLRLVSQELPMLNLKSLNDIESKQEGVPFNLSIGGGTQGLCDTVGIDYRRTPKVMYPLEKEFCGSFVGYIRLFRFYACPVTHHELEQNYLYDQQFQRKGYIYI